MDRIAERLCAYREALSKSKISPEIADQIVLDAARLLHCGQLKLEVLA